MRNLNQVARKVVARYQAGERVARLFRDLRNVGLEIITPTHTVYRKAREAKHGARFKHGHSYSVGGRMKTTPEYNSWQSMLSRCYNPKNNRYDIYGDRGIRVCDGLRYSFINFLKLLKDKPEPKHDYSLDRKDNEGNYSCGRCEQCKRKGWTKNLRWATRSQQMLNRRPFSRPPKRPDLDSQQLKFMYEGQRMSMPEISRAVFASIPTIHRRLIKVGAKIRPLGINQSFEKTLRFSLEEAQQIRAMYSSGKFSQREIARNLRVAQSTINAIVLNKRYVGKKSFRNKPESIRVIQSEEKHERQKAS